MTYSSTVLPVALNAGFDAVTLAAAHPSDVERFVAHDLGCPRQFSVWKTPRQTFPRGAGGGFHFFGGALADAFGFAVAPDISGQNCFVSFVNQIAYGLANEMIGN